MDNMLEHPWTELQLLIKEKWLTQKAFASILWKKVSEVNELLKWKRNITIQRDYLLHQTLWTPIKYWILKQIDYDYSLIDIDEAEHQTSHSEQSEESTEHDTVILSKIKDFNWETDFSPNESGEVEEVITQDSSSLHSSEWQDKDDEDRKKRAKIFKSF